MNKQLLKEYVGWGIILWFVGYILGIILFMVVPSSVLGWIIMPVGIILTLFVLIKKIHGGSLQYYLKLAVIWTLIAIIFDYLFIVKLFHPVDGYYKPDVYLYYVLTFLLPIFVGYKKISNHLSMKINAIWHKKNRMVMPTTLAERVAWHEEHLKHCSCRKDLPKTILAELKKRAKLK